MNELGENSGNGARGTSATVMVYLPSKLWLGKLSRAFPYCGIEIKSFLPIQFDPPIGNSLIRLFGDKIQQVKEKLSSYLSLKNYFIMDESSTHLTLNTHTNDPLLLKVIMEQKIIVNFPVIVEKGVAKFDLTCSRKNLDGFLTALEEKRIEYDVKTIEDYTDEQLKSILTSKQYKAYQKAKELGYYDVPRKITLTDLAKELGVAKSSLSSMMQRIHNSLLGS